MTFFQICLGDNDVKCHGNYANSLSALFKITIDICVKNKWAGGGEFKTLPRKRDSKYYPPLFWL